ncbi:MAG: caspase family protein [Pseudomonadota bacterium]
MIWAGLALLASGSGACAERLHGLVIGIDDYAFVSDLHGAVNDARDIADALEGLGGDVTMLLDGEATRAAILSAWEAILTRAAPGDTLVISYAGHGSHEPEHSVGSEADGRDENFLLAGFAPRGASAAERIRDDEIAELLRRSAGLEVIFVADACHAGTVTRNIDPVLGFRYVEAEGIAADPLPPPPPPVAANPEGLDGVALFLAAVDESQRVPEVMIDGVPRGALSYAFASGLRGLADRNSDGLLTKGELESHVRRVVRQASDGVQLPQSEPAGQETRGLIALGAPVDNAVPVAQASVQAQPHTPPPRDIPLRARAFADLPPVAVQGLGWEGVVGVSAEARGSLRIDGAALISGIGDHLTTITGHASLQSAVDARRLIEALSQLQRAPLSVAFDGGDRLYRAGEALEIRVDGRSGRYLTLINLSADGTLSYLYPDPGLGDPESLAPAALARVPVAVAPPFGADHVIALDTARPPVALRRNLRALSGRADAAALWELLRGEPGTLAVFAFFTGESAP